MSESVADPREDLSAPITSLDQAKARVKSGAHLTALLGAAVALRDSEVIAAQNRHAALIDQLSGDITAARGALKTWAEENRKEFGDKQSLEFPEGVLEFRVGNRALALINDRWDWDKVKAAMKGFWRKFLIPKTDIDKRAILTASKGDKPKLTPDRLKKIGLKVVQEESFDVEFRATPPTLARS